MEPTQPNQQPAPASAEVQPGAVELPKSVEKTSPAEPAAPAAANLPPAPPAPPESVQSAQARASAGGTTATPAKADDADVIEKDWVDAVEKMEQQTAGDPHAEEQGFEDIQVDYIHKRFGKDIKKPKES